MAIVFVLIFSPLTHLSASGHVKPILRSMSMIDSWYTTTPCVSLVASATR